jgi:hypothetical protein
LGGITGTFTRDETVTSGSNTASVVEWTTPYIYVTRPINFGFANAATITGGTSGATATIIANSTPSLEAYTGDLLYVENRVPISRASDQIEDVKLIIQF